MTKDGLLRVDWYANHAVPSFALTGKDFTIFSSAFRLIPQFPT
jgi:hypothetical protein